MTATRYKRIIAWLVIAVATLAAVWWQQLRFSPPGELTVTFFDIGQGDSSLVVTPAGQTILIDGGPSSVILEKLGRALPWHKRTIDLVVLSHPHADHVTGLVHVLRRYHVNHVLMTGVVHTIPEYAEFLELVRDQNIPVTVAAAGQEFSFAQGVRLEVLWPQTAMAQTRVNDLNSTSIVNRLVYGDTAALFTGDTPVENEQLLLASGAVLTAQVLKVAHQGSKTSSDQDFLRAVAPEIAVISVGAENRYGHPSREVEERLHGMAQTVVRTDQQGDVRVVSDGHSWRRDR